MKRLALGVGIAAALAIGCNKKEEKAPAAAAPAAATAPATAAAPTAAPPPTPAAAPVARATGDLGLLQGDKWNEKGKANWTLLFNPDGTYHRETSSMNSDGTYKLDGKGLVLVGKQKTNDYQIEELTEHKLLVSKTDNPTDKTEYDR